MQGSADCQLPKVFIFNWPSFLGGADTKLAHLVTLLHSSAEITVVPNEKERLLDQVWTDFLHQLGVKYALLEDLPVRLEGVALSMCNGRFFTGGIASRAKEMGLKVIWSSEMMWHHPGELEAIKHGLVDHVLYASEFQKTILAPGYGGVPSTVVGNYIDPAAFPFAERQGEAFTIGRLSRAAPEKFPEDFPVFYEALELKGARFRVMAWDANLAHKYRWHHFDHRWDLLAALQESQEDFLHNLDLFVYSLGHRFQEAWGRSCVEAMLTGCIPLVPDGHQFDRLLTHGHSGFICRDFLDYKQYAQELQGNSALRRKLAIQCREQAVQELCRKDVHLKLWLEVLS
jgi:hypothetical protein